MFLLAVGVALLARPHNPGLVLQGMLDDSDSFMRLVRMREALSQGAWFGHAVSRDASGSGVVLPWSHLMDALILVLRAPLRLALAPDATLFWAGVITAPLSMGLLGLACAWCAAPLAARIWLWTAPVAAVVAPPILNYGQLGFVTHHILLVACAVAAWGSGGRAAAFGAIGAGRAAGCFTAAGIWLSPEAMPYGLMAIGVIALSWAVRPSHAVARALASAGTWLLGVLGAALLIDPPQGGWMFTALDRLSLPFICLGVIVCGLCWLPRALAGLRLTARERYGLLVLAAISGAAGWLALYPRYLDGLAGLMTPEQAAAFFGHILEMRPLDTPGSFALSALGGVLGLAGGMVLAIRSQGLRRILWAYAGLCCSLALALAVSHQRFSLYPAAAAAVMLPILLTEASASAKWRPLLRPALLAAFFYGPGWLGPALVGTAEARQTAARFQDEARCWLPDATEMLEPTHGAVVLASAADGPELLWRTGVSIVGSLYHPNIAGYMRLRAAWEAQDLATIPAALAATHAAYILACPSFVPTEATTLAARLDAGDPPPWLQPVAAAPGSPWVLYRVSR